MIATEQTESSVSSTGSSITTLDFLDSLKNDTCSILGQEGCQISRADWLFIETVLQRHADIKLIVELGTGIGLTTCYLGMAMLMRGGLILSFDIIDRRSASAKGMLDLTFPFSFDICDVIKNDSRVVYLSRPLRRGMPCIWFIDNGNKPLELEIYSKHAEAGDVFIIHDYGYEIHDADIDKHIASGVMRRMHADLNSLIPTRCVSLIKN